MAEINELSKIEKEILILAVKEETTILNCKSITENLNININEAEKAVNSLIEKGMAISRCNRNDLPGTILMKYGISNDRYVNLKELEDASDMSLRDHVCP